MYDFIKFCSELKNKIQIVKENYENIEINNKERKAETNIINDLNTFLSVLKIEYSKVETFQ